MTSRRWLWFLPLPLLCALGAWGSTHVADRVGSALGKALAAVAAVLVKSQHREPAPEGFADVPPDPAALVPV
ncbi:MAG TPA: hypothetical protein VGK73_18025, partial [Polyangiaceae bacterium]